MLEEIVAHKRREVADRLTAAVRRELRTRARPTERSLRAALAGRAPALILECKTMAPSVGRLREDFPVDELVAAYAPHAAAISVLTDARYFGGSPAHLAALRARVAQPLLCKDFILDPAQVVEARVHGADAVLLMLSILDDAGWRDCADTARALGMDCLTEVHTAEELTRALALGAEVIGINNRDLRDLRVDLAVTARLAPQVPAGVTLVAESGVRGRADLRQLAPRVDALLVGSGLMAQPDLAQAVRTLRFGAVKVCGLTRTEDARAAWHAGATHGGLIRVAGSPRQVDLARAERLRAAAPLAWVGVFAGTPLDQVAREAARLGLAAVQLHGTEAAEYRQALRRRLPADCEIWQAVAVDERLPDLAHAGADRVLLDAGAGGHPGGTGRSFDWNLLAGVTDRSHLVLAGGIGPDNAAAADALGMSMLDINSGVERAPGEKDAARLAACFAALAAAPGRRTGVGS